SYEIKIFNGRKLYASFLDMKIFLKGYYHLFDWLKLKTKPITISIKKSKEIITLNSYKDYQGRFQIKSSSQYQKLLKDIIFKHTGRELNIFLDKIIGIKNFFKLNKYTHTYFNMEQLNNKQYDDMIFIEKDNVWYFVNLSYYQR